MPASLAGFKSFPHPQATIKPLADISFITGYTLIRNPGANIFPRLFRTKSPKPGKHWRFRSRKVHGCPGKDCMVDGSRKIFPHDSHIVYTGGSRIAHTYLLYYQLFTLN